MNARDPKPPLATSSQRISHTDLQARVTVACIQRNLHAHHCGMLASMPGWPDLVIVGRRGVLWRELKIPPDDLSTNQRALGYTLQAAGQDWAVWTPADLHSGRIERELEAIK